MSDKNIMEKTLKTVLEQASKLILDFNDIKGLDLLCKLVENKEE